MLTFELFACRNAANTSTRSTSNPKNRAIIPFLLGRSRARNPKAIPRRPAAAVGKMGGRDKGPTQGRPSLARHLRDRGGRRPCLRRSRPPLQRQQSQAQLPRKRPPPTPAASFTGDPLPCFRFFISPFGATRCYTAISGISELGHEHFSRLLGVLEVAAGDWRVSENAACFSAGSIYVVDFKCWLTATSAVAFSLCSFIPCCCCFCVFFLFCSSVLFG